jgi:hypothetical protein
LILGREGSGLSDIPSSANRLRQVLGWILAGCAALSAVAGAGLIWLGLQPSADPHGGAFVKLPGILLLGIAAMLALLWLAVRPRSR